MKGCLISVLAVSLVLSGCREELSPPTAPHPRIISFSPALTSIVFEMGLGGHVVGVTAFCELPPGQKRQVAGDRQNVNAERILSLRPDIILIQQDPKDFNLIRRMNPNIRIEHFTIEKLDDIAGAIERIGRIAGDQRLGQERRQRFQNHLTAVRERVAGRGRPKVLFLTRIDPPSVAGRDSFIHELIELAGGQDATAKYERWTQINVERILVARPNVIVCQSEPGRQQRVIQHLRTLRGLPAVRDGRVFVITDRSWTIPSAHMSELAGNLAEMIHPELVEEAARIE